MKLEDLADMIENGTTTVTIKTPKGWKCKRRSCRVDYYHVHETYNSLKEKQYVFFRRNMGDAQNEPSTKLSESEAKALLAVVFKDPNRAINRLKRGQVLETRYATYSANLKD